MDHLARILLFFLLVDLSEGVSEMVRTQDPVMTTVGQDARLSCQLTQAKNVLQVTWQKMLAGGTEDVASYNKRFGTKINPPFVGKVDFEDTGLQNSTIVVRNVTRSDRGCYRCLFNAYPEGAIYTKTCLVVDEQAEPTFLVTRPSGTELTVVSCSVVSRPALTVTLELPSCSPSGSSRYSSVHSLNGDGTVTVSSTVTLDGFCSNNDNNNNATQVRCVVTLSSGLVKEVTRVIYSDPQGVIETCEPDQSGCVRVGILSAVVTGVAVVTIVAVGLVVRFTRRDARPNNDPNNEMKRIHQTTIQETNDHLVSDDNVDQT